LRAEDDYDGHFLISLLTFKRCNNVILEKIFLKGKVQPQVLPDFDILEEGYSILNDRWEKLLTHVPMWTELRKDPTLSLNQFRTKHGGHVLSRPIAIVAFITAVTPLLDSCGNLDNIAKVVSALFALVSPPWNGLLWKSDKGGMHDGGARRNAAVQIFSYYLNGVPSIEEASSSWEAATGTRIPIPLPSRDTILVP
jgi:hypothetical protein